VEKRKGETSFIKGGKRGKKTSGRIKAHRTCTQINKMGRIWGQTGGRRWTVKQGGGKGKL